MFSILFIVVKFLFCRIWTFSFSSSIFKIVKISRIGRYKRNDTFFDSLKFFFTVNMGNKFVQLAQQIFIVAQSRESFYFSFPYWQSLLFIFFFGWIDILFFLSLSPRKKGSLFQLGNFNCVVLVRVVIRATFSPQLATQQLSHLSTPPSKESTERALKKDFIRSYPFQISEVISGNIRRIPLFVTE